MHQEIKSFWKENKIDVQVLKEPQGTITNVPMYYHINNNGAVQLLACKYIEGSELVYYLHGMWYSEEEMLHRIRNITFL